MAIVTSSEPYQKLLSQSALLNDRIGIRDSIRIFNDDWLDLIERSIAEGFSVKARRRLKPLITTEINVLKKVAEETALVYKNAPTRTVAMGDGADSDLRYAEIEAESNINQVMKTANRFNQFCNHMLIKCVYRGKKIEYDLITPDAFDVFTPDEDWKEIIAIRYFVGNDFQNISTSTGSTQHLFRKGYLWTKYPCEIENAHYEAGIYSWNNYEKKEMFSFEENPYKDSDGIPLLPFVLTYEEWPVEKLLNFTRNSDLVVASIQTAIMMTLLNEIFKFGSFKQLVATGPINTEIPGEITSGYGTFYKLFSSDGTADLKVLEGEAAIDKFIDYAVRRIQLILAQRGIPPSAFTITGTPESGYRAQMDRKMLLDRRQDMVGFYRQFEAELFQITRVVNNTHHSKSIPDNAEFKIDFDDLAVEMTKAEDNADWTFLISQNAATPVDIIRKNNPDLNEQEATIQFEKNKALNQKYSALQPLKAATKTGVPTNGVNA